MSSVNTQPQSTLAGSRPSQMNTNTARSAAINDPSYNHSVTGNGGGGGLSGEFGDEITPEQAGQGLPEQKHAGSVGYGPEYANKNRATLGDRITGVKEQVVGKITRNPELVQKGHNRKTGDLRRGEQAEKEFDPFATEDTSSVPGTTTSPSTRTVPNEDATGSTDNYPDPYGENVGTVPRDNGFATDHSQPAPRNDDIRQEAGI